MGSVSGASGVGGLVGENYGTVTNSFWNTTTSGQTTSAGGTGLTTAQMMSVSSFTGWDIASTGGSNAVWRIYEGQTAPLLRSFLTALTLGDTTAVYNGTTQNGATNSTAGVLGTAASGRNAGTYAGYYSSQQGYDIIGGDLTITPATLTYTATPTTLPTGQTPSGLGGTVSGFVGGETLASATTGSLGWSTPAVASSQPGQYAINGSGLSSSNYVLAQASGNATALTLNVAAVVQPAPITPSQPVLDTVALLESRTLPVAPETYSSTRVSAAMNFNGTGASPNIVQPGIRLPARMDAENE